MPSLALRPFVAALALALGACQSVQVTEEEARPPSCGSSPTTSTPPRRASRFTPAERRKALETYPKIGANTLFAFLLDHEGNIRRVDLLRTSERRVPVSSLILHCSQTGCSVVRSRM